MSDVRNLRGLLLLVPLGLAGCASPVVPKPPSLELPKLAANVRAERTGDQVTVRWTTSTDTTDKLKAKPPIRALLCSEDLPQTTFVAAAQWKTQGKDLAPCRTVASATVVPGESELSYPLPHEFTVGTPKALVLRVELENSLGRSAGRSEAALIATGPALAPVEGLEVTSTRPGALVRWQPHADAAPVELQRLLLSAATTPKSKSAKSPTSDAKDHPPAPPVPVVLRGPDGQATDPGGLLDAGADRGSAYRYTAQRILEEDLAGQKLLIRGPQSQPVVFAMRDTFAPSAPTGLAAVPGPGSIDLSWEANRETDLAGYLVYRRLGDGPETKLTVEPVPSPAFRDTTAVSGNAYRYRVTAVDTSGNESKPSVEAIVTPQ